MEEVNKKISAKLKGLRAEKGYTMEEIAEMLEIHRETLQKYENNPFSMGIGTLLKMLNIYEINTTYFFKLIYGKMPITNKKQEKEE